MTNDQKVKGSFFDKDALSLENTRPLRMVLVISIFLFHLCGYFGLGRDIGHVLVAIFFMLSGYGLMYSLEHKKSYLKTFLPKRFPALYIPTVVCGIAAIILFTLANPNYNYMKEFFELFFAMPFWWFITTLMVLYMVFYLSFLFLKGRNAVLAVTLLSVAFTYMLSDYMNSIIYYASVSGFIVGILWYHGRDVITQILKKYYIPIFIALLLLLIFCDIEMTRSVGIQDMLATNVSPLIFTLLLIVVISVRGKFGALILATVFLTYVAVYYLKKVYVEPIYPEADILLLGLFLMAFSIRIPHLRKVLAIGSTISFEIFLMHNFLIEILIHEFSPDMYVTGAVAGVSVVILSIGLYYISKFILKKYNAAFDRLNNDYVP